MEEIKYRIKDKFKNQENFGKELGASRKTVSRILNHGTDIVTFFRICKMLGIDGISID
jgi:DNA-binding XRE family transcriptional regulator